MIGWIFANAGWIFGVMTVFAVWSVWSRSALAKFASLALIQYYGCVFLVHQLTMYHLFRHTDDYVLAYTMFVLGVQIIVISFGTTYFNYARFFGLHFFWPFFGCMAAALFLTMLAYQRQIDEIWFKSGLNFIYATKLYFLVSGLNPVEDQQQWKN